MSIRDVLLRLEEKGKKIWVEEYLPLLKLMENKVDPLNYWEKIKPRKAR